MTCPNCAQLQEENTRLHEALSRLERENSELRRRLAIFENPHTPPSRRIYPTRGDVHARSGRRFPGRPRGHRGSTRPRPRPDIVKEPEPRHACGRCGSPLQGPVQVSHHIVEEISNPHPRQVIDFLEFEYRCEACGSYTASRHPDCPPDGVFGKNALVQATLMKFWERLPFGKVSQVMEAQFGLPMTPASALDVARRVSDWLRPEYDAVLERIRAAKVVCVDETEEKVDGGRHWLWAFTTPSETLYAVRRSRGKRVLEEVLGKGFEGYICCDGWRSYPNFTGNIQRCWAHLLREAECLAEHQAEAKPLHRALRRLYADLNASLVGDPPPRVRWRFRAAARRRLRRWLDKPYEGEEAREFIRKAHNGFDHWFTFVTVPGLEPTNNRAERALKEPVVQRKIMGTFRNGKGTRIYETMMTLLATWRQRGVNPYDAMAQSLTAAWSKGQS